MKICILLLLAFVLSFSLSKGSDKNDIEKLAAELEKKYPFKIHFEDFPQTSWKINHPIARAADYENLHSYMKIFNEEFSKYPQSFLEKTNLKAVVFVKKLSINGQLRSAIPDYGKEILILDFNRGSYNQQYLRHVMHHEFYHMIEEEFNGSAYWKDKAWAKINESSFRYGNGGMMTQNNSNMFALTHPKKGFVNLYSMTALEEDKAEIYAALFLNPEYDKMIKWSSIDKVLRKKIDYMKNFLSKQDKKFTQKFWKKLHMKDNKKEQSNR